MTGKFRGAAVMPRGHASTLGRVKICDLCGRHETDARHLLTWTTSVERGRQKSFCGTCSRDHVRAIEAKLDSDLW